MLRISLFLIIGLIAFSTLTPVYDQNKANIAIAQSVPLEVKLDHAAICQDVSATTKGIGVSFIISGLFHLDNTYRSEITGPDGNVLIDESNGLPVTDNLSPHIPPTAPNPATLFLGKSYVTQKFGIFTITVFGSDGSKASLPFISPQCPPPPPNPMPAEQIQQLMEDIENNEQIGDRAKSDLLSRLGSALSALTHEPPSANDKKIACRQLGSAVSSLQPLVNSNQIPSAQASEIRHDLLSIMNNLFCQI